MNEYDDEPYVEPMNPSALAATMLALLLLGIGFWVGVFHIASRLFR